MFRDSYISGRTCKEYQANDKCKIKDTVHIWNEEVDEGWHGTEQKS